ncbi:hypothetical protein [Anaerotignum sp.]
MAANEKKPYLGEGSVAILWNLIKAKIPTKTSDLTNDEGFLKEHQDISGKLDKTGDGKDVTVTFTAAQSRGNIVNGEKMSTIMGKIAKFFGDMKTVAFTGEYGDLNNKPTIPTDNAELQNGAGYQTATEVNSIIAQKGYQTSAQVESAITAKGYQTESQVNATITGKGYQTSAQVQTAINNALQGITGIDFQVVDSMPATGVKGTIYLLSNGGAGGNSYDEYIYLSDAGKFEKIGTTEIDLTPYLKTEDLVEMTEDEIRAIIV